MSRSHKQTEVKLTAPASCEISTSLKLNNAMLWNSLFVCNFPQFFRLHVQLFSIRFWDSKACYKRNITIMLHWTFIITISSSSKGKVVPVHSIKAYRGRRGIAPLILNIGTKWKSSTSRPGRFTTGKQPQYSLNRTLDGHQRPFGLLEKRKVSLPCRDTNPGQSSP